MLKTILVQNRKHIIEFLDFPSKIHKNNKNYIRPLDKDIEAVFNPKTNKFFKHGECERFLFYNQDNEIVGKIAVFINKKYIQKFPTGGFGFFDCVNNQDYANFIFDFSKKWLSSKGMIAMDGPINFGERDKFWGLLIEGFHEPLYGMNYNPPYYKDLFENFGFQIYFNQLCFGRKIHDDVAEGFKKQHEKHSNNPFIKAKKINKNNLNNFSEDFTTIYNKAWASHGEGKTIDKKQVLKMFITMKPIINEEISWFVYYKDEPIAMWINIPDLNQWFKFLNGKFTLIEKFKFLILKKFNINKKMVGLVFGIIPEWQKKGIDGFMIWEGTSTFRRTTLFEDYEMQWIGDFNPKMIKIAENLDTKITRKLATYRIIFDTRIKFESPSKI